MSFVVREDKILIGKKQRRRALEVLCPVKQKKKVARGVTPTPLTLKAEDNSAEDFRIPHTDGGHIVGLSIGGPDTSENVVPMYCGFNRYSWRVKVEKEIKDLDMQTSAAHWVRVVIDYDVKDSRLPAAFTVTLEKENKKVVKTFDKMVHTAPIELKDTVTAKDKTTFQTMIKEMDLQKWTMEGYATAQKIGLKLPDEPGPYSVLDYMLFVKGYFPDVTSIQNGGKFTRRQRELILLLNPTLHKRAGVYSDDPKDPYKKKLLTDFGDSGAEIDHIIPASKAGSNAFSNARVISAACNKAWSDKMEM